MQTLVARHGPAAAETPPFPACPSAAAAAILGGYQPGNFRGVNTFAATTINGNAAQGNGKANAQSNIPAGTSVSANIIAGGR